MRETLPFPIYNFSWIAMRQQCEYCLTVMKFRTNSIYKLVTAILLTGFFSLLVSCATMGGVPALKSADQTLLAIPVNLENTAGGQPSFGNYLVRITSVDDPDRKYTITLPYASRTVYYRNLPPGDYRIADVVFKYTDQDKYGSSVFLGTLITMEAGEVRISPVKFQIDLFTKQNSNSIWTRANHLPTGDRSRRQILEEIAADPDGMQWTISETDRAFMGWD